VSNTVLAFIRISKKGRKENRHLNYSIKSSVMEDLAGRASWCNDSVDTWKVRRSSPGERAQSADKSIPGKGG
jgi:hypothetical protein